MNFCIALCLFFMLAFFTAVVVQVCRKDMGEKLQFLKNFKKGKFALIYIAAVPLYYMGLTYNGLSKGGAVLTAIKLTVELIVLKYDYPSVATLMADNLFFRITMVICFILVALNAATFTFTLIGEKVVNHYRVSRLCGYPFFREKLIRIKKYLKKHSGTKREEDNMSEVKGNNQKKIKKIFVIVGYNSPNEAIIRSVKKGEGEVLLLAEPSDTIADAAFVLGAAYQTYSNKEDLGERLIKIFGTFEDKVVNVIINTERDEQDLIYVEQISEVIQKMNLTSLAIDDRRGLNVYAFASPENLSAFYHYVKETCGCVHCIDKYNLIAMDFINNYPMTQFMTEEQLDYSTATVRRETEMNVILLGFGKTNSKLFLTSVSNNQFLTVDEEGRLIDKPVNYYIYDNKNTRNDKNLNHGYFRYYAEFDKEGKQESDCLPAPPRPARESFYKMNINDNLLYESLKGNLSYGGVHAYNYVIIAMGTDMGNIDFAEKLTQKTFEWGLENTKIFVKIRDGAFSQQVIDKGYKGKKSFYVFGNEDKVVYNIEQIVSEKSELMAKGRQLCYESEYGAKSGDVCEGEIKRKAIQKWYGKLHQVQRESNTYACLSIRLKLQLLGFDYVSKDSEMPSAEEEYYRLYSKDDPIIYKRTDGEVFTVNGKPIVDYGESEFKTGTVRNIFAVQEHQRWNAYMLINGFVPTTITEMLSVDKQELMNKRKHANLTSFEGLITYRKIKAKAEGKSEADCDVIKYDYQIMDDVVWLLGRNGYKIIKKA